MYLLWGAIYFLAGCQSGLEIKNLALRDDVVSDARVAYFPGDRSGIINDYALVDTGDTTIDGFTITDNTDADVLMKMLTVDKKPVFIQLPAHSDERDHIRYALAASSIREDIRMGDRYNIKVLNVKAIKNGAATFELNGHREDEYFLDTARRLNLSFSDNDIIVIDVDDLPIALPAEQFLKEFTVPHLVVMSARTIDSLAFFADKTKTNQFHVKGLNPGHTYKMFLKHLDDAKNIGDKSKQEEMALLLAKVLTAMAPKSYLGAIVNISTAIDPLINGERSVADLQQSTMLTLAHYFKANEQFLTELALDKQTLTQISDQVNRNAQAFNEQSRKTDEILDGMKKLLSSTLATLAEEIGRGFKLTKAGISDIRDVALPDLKRDLVDEGEKNRDDVIENTRRSVRKAVSVLVDEHKNRHQETSGFIEKKIKHVVDDAQKEIADLARTLKIEVSDLRDLLTLSMRKAIADNRDTVSGAKVAINAHTSTTIEKSHNELKAHAAAIEEELKRRISDESNAVRTDVGMLKKRMMSTAVDIVTQLRSQIDESERKVVGKISNKVTDAEAAIKDVQESGAKEIKAAIADSLIAAVKKIIAEEESSAKKLSQDATNELRREVRGSKGAVIDRVADAETTLKNSKDDSAIIDNATRNLRKVVSALIEESTLRHNESRGAIEKKIKQVVGDAQQEIADSARMLKMETSDLRDILTQSMRKIIGAQRVMIGSSQEAINAHTTASIAEFKRAQKMLADSLVQAEDEIKKRISDESDATRNEVNGAVNKRIMSTAADIIMQLRGQISGSENAIVRKVANKVTDVETAIKDEQESDTKEIKSAIADSVVAAVKKIVAEEESSTKTISKNATDEIRREVRGGRGAVIDRIADAEANIKEEIVKNAKELESMIEKRVLSSLRKIVETNDAKAKDTSAIAALIKKDGEQSRSQIQAALDEIKLVVEKEVGDVQSVVNRLPNKIRGQMAPAGQTAAMLKTLMAAQGSAYLVYVQYMQLLNSTILESRKGSSPPLNSVNDFEPEIKWRITQASQSAYFDFRKGLSGGDILKNAEKAFDGTYPGSLSVTIGVFDDRAAFIGIVDRIRAVENLNTAPNPDIDVDDNRSHSQNSDSLEEGRN